MKKHKVVKPDRTGLWMKNKNPYKLMNPQRRFLLKILLAAFLVLAIGIGVLYLLNEYPGKW